MVVQECITESEQQYAQNYNIVTFLKQLVSQ